MSDQHPPKSLAELRAKYPYQFAGQNIGFCVPKGWLSGFAKLCAKVDQALGEDKRGFHWTQLKEKFGSARFYYGFGKHKADAHVDISSPSAAVSSVIRAKGKDKDFEMVRDVIFKMVQDASEETKKACLVCGTHGELDRGDGYMLVLCAVHKASRNLKDGWPAEIWDMLEEDRVQIAAMEAEVDQLRRQREQREGRK